MISGIEFKVKKLDQFAYQSTGELNYMTYFIINEDNKWYEVSAMSDALDHLYYQNDQDEVEFFLRKWREEIGIDRINWWIDEMKGKEESIKILNRIKRKMKLSEL